ncbi:HNH endonuclease [Erwinia sp. INIA-01]|uniref:HNH endonuclease n=1 Tax=Erwinia sp. INIA01 TaxID=2991500 RepID=UPI002225AA5F|nr:HNH endonuclease [Erwinia sp. INIA01]MCW1874887.1 HNH endonuclease [Erwinia sp. INIA01]
MATKPPRTFKYGNQPIRTIIVQVIEELGGSATANEVDAVLKDKFPHYQDNTYLNLIANTVNCNRSHWSFNKTARRSDDSAHRHHQYDRLFKRGNIYEIYNPQIHGVFELYENDAGKWCFREVKSEFEEAVESALKLTAKERAEILSAASKTPEVTEVISRVFKRNPVVVAEVLFRANGQCQNCKRDAPFNREDGSPYLEVHHIEWLSRGGEDTVENAMALCPNCHRHVHHGGLDLT